MPSPFMHSELTSEIICLWFFQTGFSDLGKMRNWASPQAALHKCAIRLWAAAALVCKAACEIYGNYNWIDELWTHE